MALNKQSGNMYGFITHTWNTVKGKCSHNCDYCYMKKWGKQPELHFDLKELRTDLGENNFIFIGSSCDLFAADIPDVYIWQTLEKAKRTNNNFLVQTKNPVRFRVFLEMLPPTKFMLCTTIETNRCYPTIMGTTPDIESRITAMCNLPRQYRDKKMITVEPIMDFDQKELLYNILCTSPVQVNIGADSGRNDLPEPSEKKIKHLIKHLERYTKVIQKPNLERLLKERDKSGKNLPTGTGQ